MKKQLLKIFNSKKTAFLLLAFVGLCSFQVNAQDATFTQVSGSNWSTVANWASNLPGTNDIGTLDASAVLDGNNSIGQLATTNTNKAVRTLSDPTNTFTLTLNGTASTNPDRIISHRLTKSFTIDCNVDVAIDNKDIHNRNKNGSFLVFATGNTFNLNANTVNIDNANGADSNPIEFNGVIEGSGTINLTKGKVTLGADSTTPAFTGGITFGGAVSTLNISSTSNIVSSIGVLPASDGNSEIKFGTNQTALTTLKVDTENLTMDFDSSTAVVFSGYTTSGTEGVVNLQNYTSGELRIGTTASISLTILDTWTVDGAAATVTQDADGYIISNTPAVTTYTTTQNGTWEDDATWDGGVAPSDATDNIIINHDITINSDVTVNDFSIINMGGNTERVTVEAGHSLTIDGAAITKHQLYAESTATSFASLMLNGTVNQHIGYNRWVVSNTDGNDLISPPIIEVFSAMQSEFFANTDPTTERLFGSFNNTTGAFDIWNTTDNNTESAQPGTGYRAARATTAGTIQFKGEPATIANVDVNLTDGGHATYGKWNLIGNPYPTYLNFQAFFTDNTGKFETGTNNALYMWNGSSYTVYNNANTTATSLIAPGEGFFVKTASASETVTFTPVMRRIESDGTLVSKSANNNEKFLAKINLSSANKTYATDIYFIQNQTRGLDIGYDAGAFAGTTDGIYTNLVESDNAEKLLIQALPYDDFNNVVIPVAINSAANTELTISLDVASLTLPENTYVHLKDNVLNTTTLLNDKDYVFTPESALSGAGRFFLEFSAKSVLATDDFAVNEMLIYTNQASKSIIIKGVLKADVNVKVFDIQGRMVLDKKLDSSSITNVLNVNTLNTGIYMVQLEGKTQKVIIK